ncbi:MAG: DNA-binding response regulator [Cyanobacteria bacterium REEB65]|nr:DNA-binding response regulator [Cyanobacteria bacterium REEB65]
MARLGRRELEILDLLAGGSQPKMIARQLCISAKTVRNVLSNIYAKLDVGGCVEAAVLYRAVHPVERR